jgi:hypothetical protein
MCHHSCVYYPLKWVPFVCFFFFFFFPFFLFAKTHPHVYLYHRRNQKNDRQFLSEFFNLISKKQHSWVGWTACFKTFEAFPDAQASTWGDWKAIFLLYQEKNLGFPLSVISWAVISPQKGATKCGQKWGTLPANPYHDRVIDCVVKKMNTTVPLHVSSSIHRKYVSTNGKPFKFNQKRLWRHGLQLKAVFGRDEKHVE